MTNKKIQTATITWDENNRPRSTMFDDFYFSTSAGLDETRHIFLQQNGLPERFKQLPEQGIFTIAETGFGTGLNFLCTLQSFIAQAPELARLHFISVEKYPLSLTDLKLALDLWPELEALGKELLDNYPGDISGFHRRSFAGGKIQLTLIIDDVLEALSSLNAKADAWFLDGFAPSKNPQMWQPELFQVMAQKSNKSTTYSTFTVAQIVRNGLVEAGFSHQRTPGFGLKKEILKGHLVSTEPNLKPISPWLQNNPAQLQQAQQIQQLQTALIIGAGMAGASTARALANKGWQVTVIDSHSQPANGASGNPQGILYTRLSVHETSLSKLVLQGYRHTINLLRKTPENIYALTGIMQLPDSDKEQLRHRELIECGLYDTILQGKSAEEVSDITGIASESGGLYFPDGGWVSPPKLVKWLLDHPSIQFEGGQTVISLTRENNIWQATTTENRTYHHPVVIIACAHQANDLAQTSHIPLKAIRGQITEVPATPASAQLNCSVCAEGYIAPAHNGRHTLGATFHFNDTDTTVRAEDHQANLDTIASFAPELAEALRFHQLDPTQLTGRTGFRCTTPDYLPVVGPVIDEEQFNQRFAILTKNAKADVPASAPWQEGLYINAGHGSRGMVTCPLSGEILACHITGEASPVSQQLIAALHPARFAARKLIKGKKKKV